MFSYFHAIKGYEWIRVKNCENIPKMVELIFDDDDLRGLVVTLDSWWGGRGFESCPGQILAKINICLVSGCLLCSINKSISVDYQYP